MRWTLLLWLFYALGQLVHLWLRADLAVRSQLNSIQTVQAYIRAKASVLAARVFLETMLFIIFQAGATTWWPNLNLATSSPVIKAAMAGIFGYAADSLLDQAFAKIGLDKELPPSQQDTKAAGAAGGQ